MAYDGELACRRTTSKKGLGYQNGYLSMHIYKNCKTYLPYFQFQFNGGTLEYVQIPFSKAYISFYAYRITEPTFGAKIITPRKI